jgi:hypothetical protein
MSRPTRTNPEYAAMAYRKALLGVCVAHLTRHTGAMGEDPVGSIVSEDVVREDSLVPEEEIVDFITEMQQEQESLRLEMSRFDFVKRVDDDSSKHKPQRAQKPKASSKAKAQKR